MIGVQEVVFPPEVAEKLWVEHQLTQWEVEAMVFDPDSDVRWDEDEIHGIRVIARGMVKRQPPLLVFASFRPLDVEAGLYECITAFAPTRGDYGETT